MPEHTHNLDPYAQYSQPRSVRKTALATIITMPTRHNTEKGSHVTTVWDGRFPPIPGFRNVYSYFVDFGHRGAVAGNHYHHDKTEVYAAVRGILRVTLAHLETGEQETHDLRANEGTLLVIEPPVIHAVQARSRDGATLYVAANSADTPADTFPHMLVEPTHPDQMLP